MCGLVGASTGNNYIVPMLRSQQHRGYDGWGIASQTFHFNKAEGTIPGDLDLTDYLTHGTGSIGHVRYGTQGGWGRQYLQPIMGGKYAVAMNGTIETDEHDATLLTSTLNKMGIVDGLKYACDNFKGVFTCLILSKDDIYCFRDPYGMKPLCFGKKNGIHYVASENCAFNDNDINFVCDAEPGHLYKLSDLSKEHIVRRDQKFDPFELVYFARPDSTIDNISVAKFRWRMGELLAEQDDATDGMVTDVPYSGLLYAQGYASRSNIRLVSRFLRLRTDRSFITAKQRDQCIDQKLKYLELPDIDYHAPIYVIDDSMVRGSISKKIVQILKNRGFKNIHLRFAFFPIRGQCLWGGIDMRGQLNQFMYNKTEKEAAKQLGVSSIKFGTSEMIVQAIKDVSKKEFSICTMCQSEV